MPRLRLARPIRQRRPRSLTAGLLTTVKKGTKRKFKCIGGPFDGKKLALWHEMPGNIGTMEFGIPSYNNGERGVYRPDSENADCVTWRPV